MRTIVAQRNPYVILGIPFGSSREEANIAFARKARVLRRLGAEGRAQMTDLTWALNQVDEGIRLPEAEMGIYRIPADPSAFTITGAGALSPLPEFLPPRPGDTQGALDALRADAAHDYLRFLVVHRASQLSPPPV
ncbi:hypothetical protein F4553_006609 [Allocatelliglobosispora scoriae]|uniref:Uncharacterized protein n=1 Tax=Allocatelliglobosispora scoriae TaxID=643052 RepID=A0A841BZQ9_9ACTN|nr:hypothetical protein [Allocatelliglobosispora scoriae]MBB5873175.1 hypothetical protein [Allocatelliglobosispora scoriae]